VLSQFTVPAESRWRGLADHVPIPAVYAAGRLDADSEGLLLLTDEGWLQHRLTDPRWGHRRSYWVQVERRPDPGALERLRRGVVVQGRRTGVAEVARITPPAVPERDPPIRVRRHIPTEWLELVLREGRNRQVRRMTAAVGHPTLRLIRHAIDLMDGGPPLSLQGLAPGRWRPVTEREQRRLRQLSSRTPPRRPHPRAAHR
jgi:23S rRNA pseudouridine2457 synthase